MTWAPHVYVQKGRVPFQLFLVRTDRYTVPNEGDLTLRRMSTEAYLQRNLSYILAVKKI